MAKRLPIDFPGYDFSYQTDLDGESYRLRFRYNSRDDGWYLSLYKADGTPLVLGTRMSYLTDLLGRFRREDHPTGALVLVNDLGYNDMGLDEKDDSELIYLTEADLEGFNSGV